MPQARGSKAQGRLYEEASYGEAIGTRNGVRMPVVDMTGGLTQAQVMSRALQGNRSETMPSPDKKTVGLGTTLQPDVRSIGWLLYALFGSYSVTGPVSSLYTHVFKVDALLKTYMFEKWFSDLSIALQYIGCKPNVLTWSVGMGGLQECHVDWIGQNELVGVAPEDAAPLLHAVVGFKVPSVTLSQGGSPLTAATRFDMNINNNIVGTDAIGNGGVISDVPEGMISVSGGLDVTFTSITQYNKARNNTEEALVLTYPAAAGMSLQFLIDEVTYDVGSPEVPSPGGLIVPMNWKAFYDNAAAASSIRAILINDISSYAAIP